MKSIKRRLLNVNRRFHVFLVLMLVLSAKVMAQSATPSQKEKTDSVKDVRELTIEEVMEIAEEEIGRTAQEAVKAVLVEVGGELAFEKERAEQMEAAKLSLEAENKKLKAEVQKKQNQFFYGAMIGGAGGVVVTSLVFGIIAGVCK